MESFLRCGLLFIGAFVVFLILYDVLVRRRRGRLRHKEELLMLSRDMQEPFLGDGSSLDNTFGEHADSASLALEAEGRAMAGSMSSVLAMDDEPIFTRNSALSAWEVKDERAFVARSASPPFAVNGEGPTPANSPPSPIAVNSERPSSTGSASFAFAENAGQASPVGSASAAAAVSSERASFASFTSSAGTVKGEGTSSMNSASSRFSLNTQPASAIAPVPADSADDIIMITVLAKSPKLFSSYDLLQAISATGMQYGAMDIFHFYQPMETGNIVLFSLASATKPGKFDLSRMGDFSCRGLTLFMNKRAVPNPRQAFLLMLEKAEQLADDLEGELRAGHERKPWSQDVLQAYLGSIAC